jgi:hypothetical protein
MSKLINGNPHWHKVWELSEFFRAIHRTVPKAKFAMGVGSVSSVEFHTCGTPACHGGWATVFAPQEEVKWVDHSCHVDYSNGARWISVTLGFPLAHGIFSWHTTHWARQNPKIWGSEKYNMFAGEFRFGVPSNKKLTLKHIADWWLAVAIRLHKIQKGVPYVD